MTRNLPKYEIIIVGAGISGAVLAERYANILNKKVLVIEKRDHIGGNCYDFFNKDGLLVSKYGAHLFHTNYDDVWRYVQQFSNWYPYEHKVLSYVDGKLVPIPVNIKTVNILFNLNIQKENEMAQWLKDNTVNIPNPQNSEDSALGRVGKILYEKMFKSYTKKQWDLWPHELDASVMDRIPVRTSFDDRYFSDRYQSLPSGGYTKFFKSMLQNKNIEVRLNTDYFAFKDEIRDCQKLFFTGPIDQFFNYKYGKLQYRSQIFKFETYDKEYFQQNSVINYPNKFDFIRIVEYKHFTKQKHHKTTVSKEYSTWRGDPFYPVPRQQSRDLYEKYQQEACRLEKQGVYFIGRLANYKYINMDQAFKNALDLFNNIEKL